MGIITISQQLGSLGHPIAAALAKQLGYRLVWRDLINQAARRAGAPEVALSTMDELGLLGFCASPQACRLYRQAVAEVMQELAAEGNVVIVGRAGQAILRGHPDTVHVRVTAPAPLRAERAAREQGISLKAAQAQVAASDLFRRNYLRRLYRIRWDDPALYDLIINTERITVKEATELIRAVLDTRVSTMPEEKSILESV
ncbi:MAG: cytidylate kinase-like family protein [Chloroflexi bacterium]|nr:cytidylate kinase-like family protein [Chloroflexota bacterium]